MSAICQIQFQWKVTEHFRNRIKKNMDCSYKNCSHWKNISKEKIRWQVVVFYVLIYPLSKFGGNRTNSLWVLAFYNVPFKWKKWFEKTALNMSIRRVIFTSGQNLRTFAPIATAHLYCAHHSLSTHVPRHFQAHALSRKLNKNIEPVTLALTWCANIFVGCSVTPNFFRQITSFSDSLHHTKKQKKSVCGKF